MKTIFLESLIQFDANTEEEIERITEKIKEIIENSIKQINEVTHTEHSIKGFDEDTFLEYMYEHKKEETTNYILEYMATERIKVYSKISKEAISVKNMKDFNYIFGKSAEKQTNKPQMVICSETGKPIQKGYKKDEWYCSEEYFSRYIRENYGDKEWKVDNNKVFILLDEERKDTDITYFDLTWNDVIINANNKYTKHTSIKPTSKPVNDMNIGMNIIKPIAKNQR